MLYIECQEHKIHKWYTVQPKRKFVSTYKSEYFSFCAHYSLIFQKSLSEYRETSVSLINDDVMRKSGWSYSLHAGHDWTKT